jgi:DNA-binding NarL/FixJ family response regulator
VPDPLNPSEIIADDHEIVRRSLAATLTDTGRWSVVAQTGNGHDAVRLVETHQPDVVVLDLSMPELNGLEATRQILGAPPGATDAVRRASLSGVSSTRRRAAARPPDRPTR